MFSLLFQKRSYEYTLPCISLAVHLIVFPLKIVNAVLVLLLNYLMRDEEPKHVCFKKNVALLIRIVKLFLMKTVNIITNYKGRRVYIVWIHLILHLIQNPEFVLFMLILIVMSMKECCIICPHFSKCINHCNTTEYIHSGYILLQMHKIFRFWYIFYILKYWKLTRMYTVLFIYFTLWKDQMCVCSIFNWQDYGQDCIVLLGLIIQSFIFS